MRLLNAILVCVPLAVSGAEPTVAVKQLTFGPKHHFFGYIGHVRTIPWNASGRYIVGLQTAFQDHLPRPDEAADVILIDTQNNNQVRVVDQTRAWNFQQGTMFYWNPQSPETQFFFNDRDPATNHVFCVLFDLTNGPKGSRVREFRYEDTPFGNGGVAHQGGQFLGINYGRLARLRPVTGYPGAYDWTGQELHPVNDGIFKVDVATGQKRLIVSFSQLRDAVRPQQSEVDKMALFINHTLWNRDGDRIYFFARANYLGTGTQLNVPFTVRPDGTELTMQRVYIGGHPEWESGSRIIGSREQDLVMYDTARQEIVGTIGTPAIFPKPGADVALSPDAQWLVSGFGDKGRNYYSFFRSADGAHTRSAGLDQNGWVSGDLRIDGSPCWNRDGTQVLCTAIADDEQKTRQMFVLTLHK